MQARWPHAAWLLDRLSAELPVLEVAGGTCRIQECVPIRGAAGMSGSTDSEEGEGEYREEDDEIGEYISVDEGEWWPGEVSESEGGVEYGWW